MLSPKSVPQTMLSSSNAVPHTMLSSSDVPQTMLSKSSVDVPHTMLSSAATLSPPHIWPVDRSMNVPQTMLSSDAAERHGSLADGVENCSSTSEPADAVDEAGAVRTCAVEDEAAAKTKAPARRIE